MVFLILILAIILLILLITWGKLNPFLAFLLVSVLTGLALGLPAGQVINSVEKGVGDTLGSLVIVIVLGAMLGKLVADSGAAKVIADTLMQAFGARYVQWALLVTGFIIGIPLFYGVGFVLMVPLIFSISYSYKLPAVFIGIPLLAALSVTHGFLPPHPSPVALVGQFNADMGKTLIYGLIIAIPAVILAGPVFSRFVRHIESKPLETFKPKEVKAEAMPGKFNSFFTALLPVILLMLMTGLQQLELEEGSLAKSIIDFFGNPSIVLMISIFYATFSLGILNGIKVSEVMNTYAESIREIGSILLIIAGAGALKQVLADTGTSDQIAEILKGWTLNPLVLAWLIAAIIRVCMGSATIAGLTTAGILAPLMGQLQVEPNLMVLSVGAGSLMFSHVNDSGFWLFKEYFNMSIKDTIRTWSLMETIVSIVGLLGVLLLSQFIH